MYRLVEPKKIEEIIVEKEVQEHEVVIEPILGSVCHADLRYFTGSRRLEALEEKIPMALIHEGIGKIIFSYNDDLKEGQRVIIVPNVPGYIAKGISKEQCCPTCQKAGGDNYCQQGYFLGSGHDGIAQSRLVIPKACVIPIPKEVPNEIALLSELCTVSYQALRKIAEIIKHAQIAVFGDGPVGYLTTAMIHHAYGVPKERLTVFGADDKKLEQFHFSQRMNVNDYDFSRGNQTFDLAFDCTGGNFSENAINQAIDILQPLGGIVLMGVTEKKVPINTRDILEKGIFVFGSSRSSYEDYPPVLEMMKDTLFQNTITALLSEQHWNIDSPEQFFNALDTVAHHQQWQKSVLEFHW